MTKFSLVTPMQMIMLLRARSAAATVVHDDDTADMLESAARMLWRFWQHADPAEAAAAKSRLFVMVPPEVNDDADS